MIFTKEQAISIAIRCAKEYKAKLANRALLVIYRDRMSNEIKSVEIVFRPSNFQHLTGIIMVDRNGEERSGCALEFFRKCTSIPFLTKDEVRFKEDGTTFLKLSALPCLMDFSRITKICGNYNGSKNNLEADAIAGGVNFSLAISKTEASNDEFFPRSALLEDIRNLVDNPSQVLAIFRKAISDDKYSDLQYVAKGTVFQNIVLPSEISDKINLCLNN